MLLVTSQWKYGWAWFNRKRIVALLIVNKLESLSKDQTYVPCRWPSQSWLHLPIQKCWKSTFGMGVSRQKWGPACCWAEIISVLPCKAWTSQLFWIYSRARIFWRGNFPEDFLSKRHCKKSIFFPWQQLIALIDVKSFNYFLSFPFFHDIHYTYNIKYKILVIDFRHEVPLRKTISIWLLTVHVSVISIEIQFNHKFSQFMFPSIRCESYWNRSSKFNTKPTKQWKIPNKTYSQNWRHSKQSKWISPWQVSVQHW